MISELIQNLIAINNIAEGQDLSFDNALSIVKKYDVMPEPNDLIDEAEIMATSDIDALEKSGIELKRESERFLNFSLSRLLNSDFKTIAQSHTNTFYERFQTAEDDLNPYWKAYCQLNNRLDYLDVNSRDYQETEKCCAEAKAEHDERQKVVHRLYSEYHKALKDTGPILFFKVEYLEVIILKYRDIASAILADIKRIKEGCS